MAALNHTPHYSMPGVRLFPMGPENYFSALSSEKWPGRAYTHGARCSRRIVYTPPAPMFSGQGAD
jgi:hypothetical protein